MKNIFCILFSIISISSFGQDIDINIQTGDFYRDKMINTTLSFSESDNNGGIIAVRNAEATLTSNPYPKEYFIEHYDKNLKLIKEITITNDNMSQFKGLMIKNGKILASEVLPETARQLVIMTGADKAEGIITLSK
uniref:hypothetical protein n=1 Tax=uncultured Winogradskyella sp. TaxID=395353 RepID=UPI0030ED19FE